MLIVPRSGWGAAAPLGPFDPWPLGQPSGYTVHWEGAGGTSDHSQCAAQVRSIQDYHQHHGYYDIAYNFCICLHGVVYEGRGWQWRSAAQAGGNPLHVAVCFIWGPAFHLTQQAMDSLVSLIQGRVLPVIGHRDEPSCSTDCPGDENELFVHRVPALVAGPPVAAHPGGTPLPDFPPPAGFHHPVLRLGARGIAVMELQRKLDGVAGGQLAQDGIFGPLTQQAVENFQRFFKLQVDGVAGPQTWGMLDYCAALKGVH